MIALEIPGSEFSTESRLSARRPSKAEPCNRATIRKFVVAGQFIDTLRCFENGMTEEVRRPANSPVIKLIAG